MRFHPEGPSIPDLLLNRCDAGRVVFLCGAGVSVPSGMPNFIDLTKYVVDFFDPPCDSEIMRDFRPWIDGPSEQSTNIPLDQIFNLLHLEYGKDEVNALVTKRLSKILDSETAGYYHDLIRRISSSQNGVPQIVTTNFDRLFEKEQNEKILNQYVPPNFPELDYGSSIEGITYLHGRLVEENSKAHPYVLSSADFGRAYLSEGWATKFIRNLLERYTVVLLGYKAEDPPVKYLLQGLNHDGQYDRSKIYAFDRGLPETIEANWRDRGVTAIAYPTHAELWKSMEAWAVRADDSRKWRAYIIAKSQQDPKTLAPYERGQVAHVLRTTQGARLFSNATPISHPEWICVMDANIRSASQSSSYGDDPELFEPYHAYGLDDDIKEISDDDKRQGVSNDNLLTWRDEDDNPHEFHRLGDRQVKGFESAPIRLAHLINWICRSIDSPVIAWWAIQQNSLHPRMLHQLKSKIEQSKDLGKFARTAWNLILEYHDDPRNHQWHSEWYAFENRISIEGWTLSTLREFQTITTPRLSIRPPSGLGQAKPPKTCWENIALSAIGHWEVVFLEKNYEILVIPDCFLKQAFGILVEQLSTALGMLQDIESFYIHMPVLYSNRNATGGSHLNTISQMMEWLVALFDKITILWPDFAGAHSKIWPKSNFLFFEKLRIYALNKDGIFNAKLAAQEILSLNSETFWEPNLTREILFLLLDRWKEFSQLNQHKIFNNILHGPPKPNHWGDEDFSEIRDKYAARYGRYLEINGCKLTASHSRRLYKITEGITGWHDDWAKSISNESGSQVQWVATNEKPDKLLNITDSEVITKAEEESRNDFRGFVDNRPFHGLVKSNPRKALSALKISGRNGNHHIGYWSVMINELGDNIDPRLMRALLNRISKLPYSIISELGSTLGRWLEKNFTTLINIDHDLGFKFYDHVSSGILIGSIDTLKSNIGEVSIGGKNIKISRRTYDHAINSPIGSCAIAIFEVAQLKEQDPDSLIPEYIKLRLEYLLSASGEGSDHAVAITMKNLNWIMYVDPDWAKKRLISLLNFEYPSSEPAWNGLLHSSKRPSPRITEIIKPLMLKILPWIENLSWDRDLSLVAVQWIMSMRLYSPNLSHGLSRGEIRLILRTMSDDNRNKVILLLAHVGQTQEDGWSKYVIPLIENDWPRERQYRTSASIKTWISMLDDTRDSFPQVYKAVKIFLVPVEMNDHPFYMFTHQSGDKKPIIEYFPKEMLDLINTVTPNYLSRAPYHLPELLNLIAQHEPSLISEISYLRLIDLVERS